MDKTIEERADEVVYEPIDGHPLRACEVMACAWGYHKGATEQKKIDIDKACEWLRKQYPPYMEYDAILDAMLDNFKKAMEE